MTNLSPCPFCGGEAEWCKGAKGDGSPWRYLACAVCEAMGPHDVVDPTDEQQIAAWNRRPIPAEGQAVAKLQAIYEKYGVTPALREAFEKYSAVFHPAPSPGAVEGMREQVAEAGTPEDFVLVPVEPTEAMLDASWRTCVGRSREDYIATALAAPADAHRVKMAIRYRAMIDARPAPPAKGE